MAERPNLVMFMADLLRANAVGAFGNRHGDPPQRRTA
jgi:hypothetical protein